MIGSAADNAALQWLLRQVTATRVAFDDGDIQLVVVLSTGEALVDRHRLAPDQALAVLVHGDADAPRPVRLDADARDRPAR